MLLFIIPFLLPKEFGDFRNSISQWIGQRIGDLRNFLGLAPTPSTNPAEQLSTWQPPFKGGQCLVDYNVTMRDVYPSGVGSSFTVGLPGKIGIPKQLGSNLWGVPYGQGGATYNRSSPFGLIGIEILSVVRQDGGIDSCGDVPSPNPNPLPTLPYSQGGANAADPYNSNQLDTAYEGLPLALPTNLLGVLAGLAGLIGNALDALDGIKKIGDAIGTIQKLLDLLLKDKERRDRANPIFKKKLIGFWREITEDDGYISFNQIPIGSKFAIPYAIQVVVESFPSTASRLLGTKSPDIGSDPYPLFYLQLQNNSFGIRDVIHVRSLNSFHYLDSLDRGCFYNFRQNPDCTAKFRIFYELETEEVQAQ